MALSTACQTPGAVYHTNIESDEVSVTVSGLDLSLPDGEAALLEANLHNAMELVLARYYPSPGSGGG